MSGRKARSELDISKNYVPEGYLARRKTGVRWEALRPVSASGSVLDYSVVWGRIGACGESNQFAE